MMSFTIASVVALLATSASAIPFPFDTTSLTKNLLPRQETLPPTCTNYCSVSAGCVCIRRPTNCLANYTVEAGDNCGTIVDKYNSFTATELYKWNPEIGKQCYGLQAYVPVCINVAGYEFEGAVEGGDLKTPDQTPIPIMPEITADCTKFEYVDKTGEPALSTILTSNDITQRQWNVWNYNNDSDSSFYAYAQFWNCVSVS
ncbi:hypothetical protein BDV96DRAFT_598402 [Lophiotrema nucula]|uniref:LysM domain-containing protein n=1 Tax=Lophiotrema nucula TaxID=690887 RepID=A0A6A5ZCL2_9PLEO|nr:hypothetical protein BDV96DRAFT_598402 [Lophiotrema nucula]